MSAELEALIAREELLDSVQFYYFARWGEAQQVFVGLQSDTVPLPLRCAVALLRGDELHGVGMFIGPHFRIPEMPKPLDQSWSWNEYLAAVGLPRQDEWHGWFAKEFPSFGGVVGGATVTEFFASRSVLSGRYECRACGEAFDTYDGLFDDHVYSRPNHDRAFNAAVLAMLPPAAAKSIELLGAGDDIAGETDAAIAALMAKLDGPGAADAALQLGQMGAKQAADKLMEILRSRDWGIASAAARALGYLREPRAVEPLMQCLQSDYSDLRCSAANSLGDIADARAVSALIRNLQHSDWGVRNTAVMALGRIRDPRGLPALQAAARDRHGTVAASAAKALQQFSQPDRFKAWLRTFGGRR